MASRSEQEDPKDKSYQPSEQLKLEVKILAAELAARQARKLKHDEQAPEEGALEEGDQSPTEPS